MAKLPYQLITSLTSFLGIGGLIFWTKNGGLRKEIIYLFGSDATSSDLKDRVGHVSDLIYYYALIATVLIAVVSLLKLVQAKVWSRLSSIVPDIKAIQTFLLDEIHFFVIFSGIYIYLIYNNGMGLKNKHLVLFPFWFLVSICLEMIGRALTSLASHKIVFTKASFYLYFALIIMMLAQCFGYQPLKAF